MRRLIIAWLLTLLPLPATRGFALRRVLYRLAGIALEPDVWICGGGTIHGRGALSLGRNTWLGPDFAIHTRRGAPITIGRNCDIGPSCLFLTGSHETGDSRQRAAAVTSAPITVGDGCWIGARSTILSGVTIESGCVIAAGTVVTRDVPANSLVGGVPARLIRTLPDGIPAQDG